MKIITDYKYNAGQFFDEETEKTTIVLHHTAGGDNMKNLVAWFNSNKERVATHYLINRKGEIYQPMAEKFWAHHIGLNQRNNIDLNKQSISIELSSWGQLTKQTNGGRWFTYVNGFVPSEEVCTLEKSWRGYKYFHAYTKAQLDAVAELIKDIAERHDIDLINAGLGASLCEVNADALKGADGLWTHASYRSDKTDVSPQPAFLEMLNTLI